MGAGVGPASNWQGLPVQPVQDGVLGERETQPGAPVVQVCRDWCGQQMGAGDCPPPITPSVSKASRASESQTSGLFQFVGLHCNSGTFLGVWIKLKHKALWSAKGLQVCSHPRGPSEQLCPREESSVSRPARGCRADRAATLPSGTVTAPAEVKWGWTSKKFSALFFSNWQKN